MICPKCHAEYPDSLIFCEDCLVDLIDACNLDLPVTKMAWSQLEPFNNEIFANMGTEILDNERIPYYVKKDWLSSALGIKGTGLPSQLIRIFIPETEVSRATKLLKTIRGEKTN